MEDHPRGFPKLACFLDSDDAFMIYRRFGTVFSRLILYKQDEISKMEDSLHVMDKYDYKHGNGKFLMSRVFDEERGDPPDLWPESRTNLMERLEKKSLEYGNYRCKEVHNTCSKLNTLHSGTTPESSGPQRLE